MADNNNEIWKDVVGYKGLYKVSSIGRIFKYRRIVNVPHGGIRIDEERFLKPHYSAKGYLLISLSKSGKRKSYQVHRLVAEAFIPNPDNKPFIDHINTIKDDNRVENLRWCSAKENSSNPISKFKQKKALTGRTFSEQHKLHLSLAARNIKYKS